MRNKFFFEAHGAKEAPTALTVKVGRAHSDKVKVRACLPVMWVYWGQAKMSHFLPDPIFFLFN
jgi:hypothetical protein